MKQYEPVARAAIELSGEIVRSPLARRDSNIPTDRALKRTAKFDRLLTQCKFSE